MYTPNIKPKTMTDNYSEGLRKTNNNNNGKDISLSISTTYVEIVETPDTHNSRGSREITR